MSATADIRFVDIDALTRAPRFRVDIGTNNRFRVDLAIRGALFDSANASQRNASNFAAGANIQVPGGVSMFVFTSPGWASLDVSGGTVHYRVTSWRDAGADLVRSVPLDQGATAPFFYALAPQILSIQPLTGPLAGGNQVAISGRYFSGATAVRFGATSVPITPLSDGHIVVTVPAGAGAGIVAVAVEGPAGPSAPLTYRYEAPAPAIALLDPFGGPQSFTSPASYVIYDDAGAVLKSGVLNAGETLRFDAAGTPERITVRTPDMLYTYYFAPAVAP